LWLRLPGNRRSRGRERPFTAGEGIRNRKSALQKRGCSQEKDSKNSIKVPSKVVNAMKSLLERAVVPYRLSLILRSGQTLGYNPGLNTWDRLSEDTAEALRWLRAGRKKDELATHLARRFQYATPLAERRVEEIVSWCVLRRLLYLDRQLQLPDPQNQFRTDATHLATVYWICTQACNLRCKYCYQDATVARANELSTEEGIDLVDQAADAGASAFIFTGGEPFSRRDLFQIARHSRSRGLLTNVITNGHYITRRTVDEVAEIFDAVTISLDHGLPAIHDRNRGKKSWERAVRAIELLSEAGVIVDVNSVITNEGADQLEPLISFVRKRGIGQHRITPQFPMGRGTADQRAEVSPSQLLGLNDAISLARRQSATAPSPEARVDGRYSRKLQTRSHCGAGLSEVSVDPEGWVYPCKLLQQPLHRGENVRSKRLIDIYRENLTLKTVRSITTAKLSGCTNCIIKNHCGGGCRGIHYSFTGDYTRNSTLFCAFLRTSFESQAWGSTGDLPARKTDGFLESFGSAVSTGFVPLTNLAPRVRVDD
jgi:radical SAM protein with 4Fe4S-binding SPASM domain